MLGVRVCVCVRAVRVRRYVCVCACCPAFGPCPALFCQYVGLPYMTDPRHAPDTLFLIAEADWRLFPTDCAGVEWLAAAGTRGALRPRETGGSPRPPEVAGEDPRDEQPVPAGPPTYGVLEAQDRAAARASLDTAHMECLRDIVRVCTLAHRNSVGNVVWLSYACGRAGHAKSAKPSLVSFGALLLAFTKHGARRVSELATDAWPEHWDL